MIYLKYFETKFKYTDFEVGDEVYLISLPSGHTDMRPDERPIIGQKYKIKEIIPTTKKDNTCDDSSPNFLEYHIYLYNLPIYQFFLPEQLTRDPKHPIFKKIHQDQFDL